MTDEQREAEALVEKAVNVMLMAFNADEPYHETIVAARAVVRLVLERAAEVAEANVPNAEDWDSSYWDQVAMGIAFAIRRLIPQAPTEGGE